MGFKARARQHAAERGETPGGKRGKKSSGPKQGTLACAVNDCENWADKELSGRSISFDDATEVWDEDGINGSGRRVRICRVHYREWKKAMKDDRELAW